MAEPILDLKNGVRISHQGSAVFWLLCTVNFYIDSLCTRIFTITLPIFYQFQNALYENKIHSFRHHLANVLLKLSSDE